MSFKISKVLQFPQSTLQYIPQNECDMTLTRGLPLLGGVLSDTRYVWHAKGPCLEVRNTKTGTKVGAWTFGCILKDSNTRVVCVDEIQRLNGRLSLLAIGIECTISEGLICIFDIFGSKVIRAIEIKEKITSLHVIDSGCEVLNLPGPLRNFDGIIAVGTEGGNVFLVDICRQICEEALYAATVRDELCPCQLTLLTLKDIPKIEYFKEQSVTEGDHLAIHLNMVFHSQTQHFTLKGPKGEDRIHVNKEEVVTSALYYCSQLTSLLIGFNFGAFQLWDLTSLNLVYTSPVCEEHLPITHFALQEPADDPRAFCYVWVSYSNSELFQSGLPFAVMYSVCYDSKEFHEGYGYLYQDFQSCSVRFQVELGPVAVHKSGSKAKGGCCIGLQPIYKVPANRDLYSHDNVGDILALCAISWTVWFNQNQTQSNMLVFDLNQWYKEQMPHFTKGADCSNYILKVSISDLITMAGHKGGPLLNIHIDKKSLRQFSRVQRLEEHFCPTALSFDLWGLCENHIVLLHNEGLQKALLSQMEIAGPLCLIRPNDVYRQVVALGLSPLFMDISMNIPVSTDVQREIVLNVGLEHQLIGWLCRCASEWANGSFSSAGCSLDFLMHWAFQRAILLKNNCDKYCMPLFDYSQSRLDNNTSILLNNCTRQINNLCTLYSYVINKLASFISNQELIMEQHSSLKMVSMYFEVLQWLINVGLLPECHPSTYPKSDNTERISAPYPIQELTEYYNEKRTQLQLLSKETFVSSDSLLFIDNLIKNNCGAEQLHKQWQEDGGSGLYPPPSLQSMLRTYLVQGADISHKHSLVIYVFLDLAMALDQNRYASVITHLIKFPAVFKVSSSIIKITQAFWQLDHGDYTTAMEQLLDPFVLGDDLQPWHHAIAMRGLLLQNQYNFALLYMQVRRPPITDEKDVLTAISLFIANNMLDEAFYFKNQHHNNNEEKLLMHLFNECNKNESLHVLLYRCLNTNEEKAFFKYLKSRENPSSDDLQVFYYLMRSRFVEAFDTHHNSKRKRPERQGLIGQRNATKTDQIVRIFKTLLPDVNRNLVDVIRKERTNLWKEVARPTPLSVFVHNANEQVKYKSTIIQAALAKAKLTFSDSTNNSNIREVITEETPFLRTPKASRISSRHATPIITPKVIEVNEYGEEIVPSPCKKLKLTPRTSTTSPTWNHSISIHSTLLTPIVKRKTSLQKDQSLSSSNINVCTPQSILKVRNLVRRSDTVPDDMLENCEELARIENSPRKSGLGLLPRKSLSRIPRRPHVQFDDAARFSSSFSDQSIKPSLNSTPMEDQSLNKSTLSSKDISLMVSSKNSSASNTSNTDDVFYSPNTSVNELSKSEEENSRSTAQSNSPNEEVVEKVFGNEENKSDANSILSHSPRARRSYKRSLGETPPVRTSLRIARNSSMQGEKSVLDVTKDKAMSHSILDDTKKLTITTSKEESVSDDELSQIDSPNPNQSPRLLQKVKGRKSLNRQVLENNTLSRMMSTPLLTDQTISKVTTISKMEKTVISENTPNTSEVTTIETKMEISDTSVSESDNKHIHTSSSSLLKKKVESENELHLDSDTSVESNISFDSPELPESLKMSNSLLEWYMKSRDRELDNADQTASKANTTQVEESQIANVSLADSQKVPNTLEAAKFCSVPIEVYEDLSSGTEDIEEVLTASRRQMDSFKVYGEWSNNFENTSSRLKQNTLETTDSREHLPEKDKDEAVPVRNIPNINKTSAIQNEESVLEDISSTSKDKSILSEVESFISNSPFNQSSKLFQKVRGRKSLSRQVLEHNTLSKMMAPTPVTNIPISKEASDSNMEKTLNTSESNISYINSQSCNSGFEAYLDTDTSFESNISLDCPELPDNLKLSDSLLEYMKSRCTKANDADQIANKSDKTQIESDDSQRHPNTSVEAKVNPEPMEIYEDLSSGAEDIEEVLTASKLKVDNSKVYAELSNCSENAYDELEKNIFDITESREHSVVDDIVQENIPNISDAISPSSTSHVPEAEKAFIISPSNASTFTFANSYLAKAEEGFIAEDQTSNPSKQENDVIEINSSSDDEDTSTSNQTDTSDSRSLDKSDSDGDDLNISYERNIHVEENSRSLLDSEFNASTADHSSELETDESNHADERDNIIEHAEESNNESVLEINEDNSSVDWMNNDQESDEETKQPILVVDEHVVIEGTLTTNEDEKNKLQGSIQIEIPIEPVKQESIKMEINKEASLLHIDGNEMEEIVKDKEEKLNFPDEVLCAEELVETSQESHKKENIEITEKENFERNESNLGKIQVEENYVKEILNVQSNISDTKSSNLNESIMNTKTEGDFVENEKIQKESKEQQTNTPKALKDKTTFIFNHEIEKKNQSTNTTVISDAIDVEHRISKQLTVRIEQSTNTTVSMPVKEKNLKNYDSILEIERPVERKVYHPKYGTMKIMSEDQTISSVSSDTTEGESSSQAILVTAQVHTPSKEPTEAPLSKQITRRSSIVLSQTAESDILGNVSDPEMLEMDVIQYNIIDEDHHNTTRQTPHRKAYVTDILDNSTFEFDDSAKAITPGRRTRRSQSAATIPSRSIIKTRRSSHVEKNEELDKPSTSSDVKRETNRPLRRTRSASVDEVNSVSRKRSLRSSSIDEKMEENVEDHKPKTKEKAASVSQLPVISEERKEQSKSSRKSKSNSTVEAYTTTRRLTRRQANLIKGIQTPSNVTAQDDSDVEKSLEIDTIDPIKLLDKEPFQGKPDPEEEKVYQPSSPSNSTSSFSKPLRRMSRSASLASDSSLPPSASQPSTPKRRTRQSIGQVDSPSPSGVKMRLRKHSETSSITSEKSDPPTPKRARKKGSSKEDADESNSGISIAVSTRSTRSRANSTSSVKSDTLNSPKRTTRNRRLVSTKSDLPEITEEKVNESEESSEKPGPKRQTRKKSSQ